MSQGCGGFWRVYKTLQQGEFHNDVMPDLRELPDLKGRMKTPISSDKLIGQTVDWFGKQFTITGKRQEQLGYKPCHRHGAGLGHNADAADGQTWSYGR
jgi:hypothetical protein